MYDLYDLIGAALAGMGFGILAVIAMNTWPRR